MSYRTTYRTESGHTGPTIHHVRPTPPPLAEHLCHLYHEPVTWETSWEDWATNNQGEQP